MNTTSLGEFQTRGKKKPANELDRPADAPETTPKDPPEPDADGQLVLIDTKHAADKEIEALVEEIKEADKERGAAEATAAEKRGELLKVLHKHGIKKWAKREDEVFIKAAEETVSVKKRKKS